MSLGISGLSSVSRTYPSSSSSPQSGNSLLGGLQAVTQAIQQAVAASSTPSSSSGSTAPVTAPAPSAPSNPTPVAAGPATPASPVDTASTTAQTTAATVASTAHPQTVTDSTSLHALIAEAEAAHDGSGISSIGAAHAAIVTTPTAAETGSRTKAEIVAQAAYALVAQADSQQDTTQALLKHA